jgi:hypothetical protein
MLILPEAASAWTGNTWANITRATIKSNADQMIDSAWVPKNTFTNWQYGTSYLTYYQGVSYTGVAYTQNNPQENWSEFSTAVTNTAGGSVGFGNDCSGFVSICWRLPARYTTALFESQIGTYWTSLGETGSAATASLLLGDALNRGGSHIILFLNYESGGVRSMEQTPDHATRRLWSYSGLAAYRPIRRLQITDAPAITSDGICRVADAGQPATLSVTASGTAPLRYQWRLNGSDVAGATSSNLTFAAAQLTNAGSYTCVVTNSSGSVTSRVMSLTVYPPQATVFLDTFDADTSANWNVNRSSSDTRLTFNYDYSAMGIVSAPGSAGGTTRGVRMEANLSGGAVAALSLSPKNQVFGGDYRLRFDMWINVNGPLPGGGTGSTEHLTGGLGTTGNRVQWTGTGSTADGCWFSVDGEGGASDTSTTSGDFCAFVGASLQNPATGYYAAGTDSSAKGNSNTYYVNAFPGGGAAPPLQQANFAQQTGTTAAGAVGFAWHEVIIARRGTTVDWAMDGIRLATITNATFTASNVFVGYWDSYASLSDNTNLSFGLVDNVRVEVPATPPSITAQPQSASVWVGYSNCFSVGATGTAPLGYQWKLNGTNLPGATASAYACTNAQMKDAGSYSVVVSNVAGTLTSSGAVLTVTQPVPPRFEGLSLLPDGRWRLDASGIAGHYAIEASTNLMNWIELTNFVSAGGGFQCLEGETNFARRFYRLRLTP